MTQPNLFDLPPERDICGTRSRGNPESQAAHQAVLPTKAELRNAILIFLKRHGPATCEELADQMGLRYTTASARLSELKRDGLAIPTGERRPTSTGSLAGVVRAAKI